MLLTRPGDAIGLGSGIRNDHTKTYTSDHIVREVVKKRLFNSQADRWRGEGGGVSRLGPDREQM